MVNWFIQFAAKIEKLTDQAYFLCQRVMTAWRTVRTARGKKVD